MERRGRDTLIGPRLQLIGTWALGTPGAGGVLVTVSICLAVHVFPPSFGAVRETRAPVNMSLVLVLTNCHINMIGSKLRAGMLTKICICCGGHL